MIIMLGRSSRFTAELKEYLGQAGLAFAHYPKYSKNALENLYRDETRLAIIEFDYAPLPQVAWIDILGVIAKRIPLVVYRNQEKPGTLLPRDLGADLELADFYYRENPAAKDLFDLIVAHRHETRRPPDGKTPLIPVYDPEIPLKMLKNDGAISFLAISGSKLRSIALEYGSETYEKVQECFQGIFYKLWGAPGSFRREDILVRKSPQSNDYLMFLQKTRSSSSVPAPGVTEKLANRVAFRIQTALWEELLKSKENRILPDCLKVVPDISVGYATAINNPCEDPHTILETVLEKSFDVAKIQQKRILDRQREVMQTLIQHEGILYPHFQGVFQLSKLTRETVKEVVDSRSIESIRHLVVGFESLIRVRKELVEPLLRQDGLVYMDSQILRPDVLFQIAHTTLISLELDQACLKQALKMSEKLPGKLLVNILPRNLYYILSILPMQTFHKQIVFEVSESEGIQNFDLIMKLSRQLKKMNMSIAADDFGRGYAGLERVLRIEPELIKLDRALIENIHKEKSKRSYVKGLVDAARESKSTVLAEGVETWEEAEVLKDMGIELIQGFLLHRPQPIEHILSDLNIPINDAEEEPSVA